MVSAYMVWFCCPDLCFLELGLAVGRSDGETEESTYPEHELAVIEPMVGTNLASQKWQRLEDLIGLQIIKLFAHWCLAEAPKHLRLEQARLLETHIVIRCEARHSSMCGDAMGE